MTTVAARRPRGTPSPLTSGVVRPSSVEAERRVREVVVRGLPDEGPLVLAVSGGLDSTVLLDAVAATIDGRRITVATFDHGTGPAARAAVEAVVNLATSLRLRVVTGRATTPLHGESSWREARWRFLREVAATVHGPVVTAHTRDDQIETVALRLLRGAGARGLAALRAPSADVLRPLLDIDRATLERYARERALAFETDPSNASILHARNRVRHQLLPALRLVWPTLDADLLEIGQRAASWRGEVDALAEALVWPATPSGVRVARRDLAGYDAASLSVLWPAIAARAAVTLDRRGTRRLASFTRVARTGARVPLSNGATAVRERDAWWIGYVAGDPSLIAPAEAPLLEQGIAFGEWTFDRSPHDECDATAWAATLPAGARLAVREWRPGDRMAGDFGRPARRVKRWFAEAGIASPERRGWPVVLADGEIVWIPGVRRSDAASDRSGRPGLRYLCERNLR